MERQIVKTTIELPADLYRRAKAEAALTGRRLKDVIEEGLRLVIEGKSDHKSRARPSVADLMRESCGMIDSGTPDLASNPAHLDDLGRDSMS